ncbi:MAG TPA: VOC family protein [Bacillales bacterium]
MKPTGLLHHVEIYVSNLAKSKAFYSWWLPELGYEKFQEWPQGISWRLGDTYLVFVQTETSHLEPGYHRKRTGLNHLAFHAESREHVDRMTEKLKTRGITILYEARHPFAGGPSHYAVFFEDPDRVKLELVAPQ